MKYSMIALPALALLAACGARTETTTNVTETIAANEFSTETDNGADNAMVATPTLNGPQFADLAAATDAYEIAAGKLAQQKGSTQAIQDFGATMVQSHTESSATLRAAADGATPAIVPNPAFTSQQESDLQQLRNATGTDFDAIFRTLQIAAHQKTLAALEGYGATGDVPELRTWAASTAPMIRKNLGTLRGM